MNNPVIIALLIKGFLSILLGLGGFYALNRGYLLFLHGVGKEKENAFIEVGKFKASAKTIGSFVMITSCCWAFLCYKTAPIYKDGNIEVANLSIWKTLRETERTRAGTREFNLSEINLEGVNLEGVNLEGVNLTGVNFKGANLESANLASANLEKADLSGALLAGVNFEGTNLKGAKLTDAYFVGAINLTIKQLSEALTLYDTNLDPKLMVALTNEYPHLFKKSTLETKEEFVPIESDELKNKEHKRTVQKKKDVSVKNGVFIRNDLALKVITKRETLVYNEPDSNSSVFEKVGAFKILFVFSPDPENNKMETTTNGFYKIGQTPNKEKIMGWVNENDLQEWDHREVAAFAPLAGRELAKIYKTKDDLKIVLQSKNPDARDAIAQELPSTSEKRYKMLLPILNVSNENIANQNRGLCQIAFLDSPNLTGKKPSDKLSSSKKTIEKHGQLDIMFVMDTTAGMANYIKGTKEAVKTISKEIAKVTGVSPRFGIVGYRDRIFKLPQKAFKLPQKAIGYIYKTYTPLIYNYEEFQKILDSVDSSAMGAENTPEAVFDGLNEAINGNIGWREHGVKAIILIGDASANVTESGNPLGYTINDLLKDASAKAIRIYAINIAGEDKGDNEIQEKQWKSLADGLTPGTKGAYIRVSMGSQSVDEYVMKLNESISNEFMLTRKLMALASTYAKTGTVTQPVDATEAEFMVLKRLLDRTTSKDEIASNNGFNFSTGWIQLESDGIPVIEPKIMMSDGELELLSYMLDGLQVIMKNKSNQSKLKKVFIHDLESIAGEEFNEDEDTFTDFMKKKHGIPIQTKLLRFTPQEISEWSEAKLKSILEDIGEKGKRLRAFHGDQANWNTVTNDFSYAFVPVSFFP